MAKWSRDKIDVERVYTVTDVPDLQDTTSSSRMIIRPRTVTLLQVYGTSLVRGAVIEGRQVRRDGGLARSKMILAGIETDSWGYSAAAPPWLHEIMAAEGLEWTTRR